MSVTDGKQLITSSDESRNDRAQGYGDVLGAMLGEDVVREIKEEVDDRHHWCEKVRRHTARARFRGDVCATCGRELLAEEPIWRSAVCWRTSPVTGKRETFSRAGTAPRCQDCKPDFDIPWNTGSCPHCGRTVHQDGRWQYERCYFACSRLCAERAWSQAYRDRHHAGRTPRACEVCEDTFTPPRSDGRYCSPSCRQKAYRARNGGRS